MKLSCVANITVFLAAFCLSGCGEKNTSENISREIITFKGTQLGVPGMRGKLAEPCKSGTDEVLCDKGKSDLFFHTDFGNLRSVLALAVIMEDGTITRIEFDAPKNEVVELAGYLSEKYGEPKKENDQAENKLGQKFDKEIYTWKDKNGNRLIVQSIYDDINTGRVDIISARAFNAAQASKLKEAEAAKNKL